MPMKTRRDHNGDPLISIPCFRADEIRELSADAEPYPGVREYLDNEGLVRVSNDAQFYGRQLQRAHDKIYELKRDGDLHISALEDRHRSLRVASCLMVMGALLVGFLIGRLFS